MKDSLPTDETSTSTATARSRGRSGRIGELRTRLEEHVRTPLYRTAYLLMVSTAVTAGLGYLYWTIAPNIYTTLEVSRGFVWISAMSLISACAQLNFSQVFARYLLRSGGFAHAFVRKAMLLSVGLSVFLAAVVLVVFEATTPSAYALNVDFSEGVVFVLATAAWTWYANLDGALAGMRRAGAVLKKNTIFSLGKLVLLVAFSFSLGASGVFASWMIPTALLLVPFHVVLVRKYLPPRAAPGVPVGRREVSRFIAGDYLGFLASQGLLYGLPVLIPLLVHGHEGELMAACLSLVSPVIGALNLLTSNLMTSLVVEASEREADLAHLARLVARRVLMVIAPIVLGVVVAAPFLLALGTQDYVVRGTIMLQLVSIATLPFAVVQLSNSISRVRNRTHEIAITQSFYTVSSLGLTMFLVPSFGLTGAGVGILVSACVVATALLPSLFRTISPRHHG